MKSLSSDEEESEESRDKSSLDESSDDVAAPRTGGNDRQSVKENIVTWSEKKLMLTFLVIMKCLDPQ